MKKKKKKHKIEKMNKKIIAVIIAAGLILVGISIWWYVHTQASPQLTTHTDEKNNFAITVPSIWQTQESIAVQTTGVRTANPTTRNIEVTQLYTEEGSGVTVQIYEGTPQCPQPPIKPTTMLAGLPATYNTVRNEWSILTTTSKIVVRAYYPGTGVFHRINQITPSPLPQADIDTYKKQLTTILDSLHFNNVTPLTCN